MKFYPLEKKLRRYYVEKFRAALVWTIFWCGVWSAGIEYFYGPGMELTERYPVFLGGLCAIGLVGILVSFGYLLVRLVSLLNFTGSLKRRDRKSVV